MKWEVGLMKNYNSLCANFDHLQSAVIKQVLIDYYKQCTRGAFEYGFPVELTDVQVTGGETVTLEYEVKDDNQGASAWQLYQSHHVVLDNDIQFYITTHLAQDVKFTSISARENCFLTIGLVAIAIKVAPLVSAAAATISLGIAIHNKWEKYRGVP
jgi:hypothetical protein